MNYFKNKRPNLQKLLEYGFSQKDNAYQYSKDIMDGDFRLTIYVLPDGETKTVLKETATDEIYTLHLVEGAEGVFVGQIKEEYDKILSSVSDNCFEKDIFKSPYTKDILKYVQEKYNDQPEYLWEKFPDNAVVRHKQTQKWYAAILTVAKNKFGFDSNENVEVIDLHAAPEDVIQLVKQPHIYPGYHMNKKHWITIILDGSKELNEIYELIDKSYELAKKKSKT